MHSAVRPSYQEMTICGLKRTEWEEKFSENYVNVSLRIACVACSIVFGIDFVRALVQPKEGWLLWRSLLLFAISVGAACFTHIKGLAASYSDLVYKIAFGYCVVLYGWFFLYDLFELVEPTPASDSMADCFSRLWEHLLGLLISLACLGAYLKFFREKKGDD